MTIKTNGQSRPLLTLFDLTFEQQQDFDYINWKTEADEYRFFEYRGSIYDYREFQVTPGVSELNSLGWHGFQTESAFSAVLVKVFDPETNEPFEDEIVVGYAYW